MRALLLPLFLIATTAVAEERYWPEPLQLLTSRVDEHDKELADLKKRVCELEDAKNLAEEKAARLVSAKTPVTITAPLPIIHAPVVHAPMETIISEHVVSDVSTVTYGTPVSYRPATPKYIQPTPKRSVRRWRTLGEIRAQISRNRTSRVYGRMARGQSGKVWSHLIREHGYSPAQVNGLSMRDALMLHNLAHGPKISPYTSTTVTHTQFAAPTHSTPAVYSQPVRQTNIFIPPNPPVPQPQLWSPAAPKARANQNCANGQCASSSRSSGRWYLGKALGR